MAKKKKTSDSTDGARLTIPNLFEILTPPGKPGVHEGEIELMDFEEGGVFVSDEQGFEVVQVSEEMAMGDTFEKIVKDGLACTACELYKTRTNFVLGEGAANARLIFIGEAPGEEEDLSGRPFVGRAGRHLDKILVAAGFKREEVYICNILKDRPPGNRTPTTEEMTACTPLLRRQLALIKPKIIGLLGNTAIKFVIGPKTPGITQIHGQWFDSIFGIPCMPMYHPSYLLRYPSRDRGSPNWQMWQDIQALKKRYDEIE